MQIEYYPETDMLSITLARMAYESAGGQDTDDPNIVIRPHQKGRLAEIKMQWRKIAGGSASRTSRPGLPEFRLGIYFWELLLYETVMFAVVQFHHANLALPEQLDRALRAVQSFRLRTDLRSLKLGLEEFDDPEDHTVKGMLDAPLVNRPRTQDDVSHDPDPC